MGLLMVSYVLFQTHLTTYGATPERLAVGFWVRVVLVHLKQLSLEPDVRQQGKKLRENPHKVPLAHDDLTTEVVVGRSEGVALELSGEGLEV